MNQVKQEAERKEYLAAAAKMYDELRQWREEHPEASIDEIAGRITPERRGLMGQLLNQLARQHGDGTVIEGVGCPVCGEAMRPKGKSKRDVVHAEGEMNLERAYYYCSPCEHGIFPPG
jgi:hypothetical protein